MLIKSFCLTKGGVRGYNLIIKMGVYRHYAEQNTNTMKKLICLLIALITLFTLVACETGQNAEGCAHTLSDWVVTLEPSCEAPGSHYRRCTICAEIVVVEELERLPHADSDSNCACDGCNQPMHVFVEGTCQDCGKTQSQIYVFEDVDESEDVTTGDYIYLGQYPTTVVTDDGVKSAIEDAIQGYPTLENFKGWTDYGYYISQKKNTFAWYKDVNVEIDGVQRKFRGVYFIKYRPVYTAHGSDASATHQDDNGYFVNTPYWFEYEPIKWQVLSCEDGLAKLVCAQIIDSQTYNYTIDASFIEGKWYDTSNYMHSSIRSWLNDDFYHSAFNLEESLLINKTVVENGAASTNPYSNPKYFNKGKNPYACANTQDYVFLLSRSELTNPNYGFAEMNVADPARLRTGTDYAKAQGLYVYTGEKEIYYNTGHWWMRSAHHDYSSCVGLVNSDGDNDSSYLSGFAHKYYYTHNTNIGVVPAIVIGV